MQITVDIDGKLFRADSTRPFDLSTPLYSGEECVNAFSLNDPRFEPVRMGGFVGSVAEDGPCNCEDLRINAHGNGTHTECIGHITRERISINQTLKEFHFPAELISISPELREEDGVDDFVIFTEQIQEKLMFASHIKALLIRTLPNEGDKLHRRWSGTNPVYLDAAAARFLAESGIEHLLVDFPSVDREEDGGALNAHHAFWQYPESPRMNCTITEMFYAGNHIPDGLYLLNLQIASFESDASPSKPVLYGLMPS